MMEDKIQVFRFTQDAQAVRTIDREGEIWFVAKDVCDILEIQNPRDAIADLDNDEKGVGISDTLGGAQSLNIISEAGLYKLIFRSRKPAAKAFSRWVTHEVLPQIRRTGQYSARIPLMMTDRLQARILAIVTKYGPCTLRHISMNCSHYGADSQRRRAAIMDLVASGQIVCDGTPMEPGATYRLNVRMALEQC